MTIERQAEKRHRSNLDTLACPYCGRDCDDLSAHLRDYCRETFPNRQYLGLAPVGDMVFEPLGKLSENKLKKLVESLALVNTLVRSLPTDSEAHRRRRIAFARELQATQEPVRGSRSGDAQTGGIVFLKAGE